MTNRIEIMAPVGSYESLMAAIQAGADSVYFGVGKLNMRSRSANNFSLDDMQRIADTARQHGVRTYLTVNTIIYDNELAEMRAIIDKAREVGISAIIASDFAVMEYARSIGVEIHASTQCNISNLEAVRYYSRFADVVVTARELTLKQVADITKAIADQGICGPKGELVQIEVFAHGALCMSVSGKCYLSLDNYNYSANRGACLQLCRREYLVKDLESDIELVVDNKYIMSPKDLCTIGFIDKIVKAGVKVLKIEGRGRSADYVQTVVTCYKEALKAIEDGRYTPELIDKLTERLRTVFNRGFWDGYYLGRKMGEWAERYGSQATENKVYLGLVTNYFNRIGVAESRMQTAETLVVGDEVIITGQTTGVYRGTVTEIRLDKGAVEVVKQGDVYSFKTDTPVHRGDKLYKVVQVIDEY
ncbi:MAG: U32 family peptidase [Bacteroidales bacterium]|nr:U32 family peptidase [Bacteroidales bacterium]